MSSSSPAEAAAAAAAALAAAALATFSSSDNSEKAFSDADEKEILAPASGAEDLVVLVVAGRATATKAASGSSVGAPTFAIETEDEDKNADGEQLDDKGSPACPWPAHPPPPPPLLLHLRAASRARHSACAASGAREAGAYASSEWTRAQRTAAVS